MEQPSNKVSVTAADAGEQIKRHLSKDGYVVVTDLYTPPQCLAMQEEFTELAQKLHPEWVDEQGTFHFKHDEFLASFKGGMGHCGRQPSGQLRCLHGLGAEHFPSVPDHTLLLNNSNAAFGM